MPWRWNLLLLVLPFFASCGLEDRLSVFDDEVIPVPRLKFETPSAQGFTADAEAPIKVTFADTNAGDVWSLFYLSDAASVRGEAIFENRLVPGDATTEVTWATSDLASGKYYVYAEMVSGDRVATAAASAPIVISHTTADNADPSVTVIAPNGKGDYELGQDLEVRWNASDADGDTLSFTIEFSNDAGSNWSILATDVALPPFTWVLDEALSEGNSYRVRVQVQDGRGGAASDVSDDNFSLTRPVTWDNSIMSMMEKSCGGSACHQTGGDYSTFFDSDVYSNDLGTGVSQTTDRVVARAITVGNMPPVDSGYPALTQTEKNQFLIWVSQGTPEN